MDSARWAPRPSAGYLIRNLLEADEPLGARHFLAMYRGHVPGARMAPEHRRQDASGTRLQKRKVQPTLTATWVTVDSNRPESIRKPWFTTMKS